MGSGARRQPGQGNAQGTAGRGAARAPGRRVAPALPAPTAEEIAARLGWREAISVTVVGLGYELVDVERGQRGLLRITIDRIPGRTYGTRMAPQTEAADDTPAALMPVADSGEFITVEDCEQVTRQLQYVLQVEGLDYARLEVSSPGLDRPLRNEADLQRFVGAEVGIVLKEPFEGRKSWQGVLEHGDGGGWQLVFKQGSKKEQIERALGFRMDEVREAHLVPVVDFKGRRTGERAQSDATQVGQADGSAQAAGRSDTDGG